MLAHFLDFQEALAWAFWHDPDALVEISNLRNNLDVRCFLEKTDGLVWVLAQYEKFDEDKYGRAKHKEEVDDLLRGFLQVLEISGGCADLSELFRRSDDGDAFPMLIEGLREEDRREFDRVFAVDGQTAQMQRRLEEELEGYPGSLAAYYDAYYGRPVRGVNKLFGRPSRFSLAEEKPSGTEVGRSGTAVDGRGTNVGGTGNGTGVKDSGMEVAGSGTGAEWDGAGEEQSGMGVGGSGAESGTELVGSGTWAEGNGMEVRESGTGAEKTRSGNGMESGMGEDCSGTGEEESGAEVKKSGTGAGGNGTAAANSGTREALKNDGVAESDLGGSTGQPFAESSKATWTQEALVLESPGKKRRLAAEDYSRAGVHGEAALAGGKRQQGIDPPGAGSNLLRVEVAEETLFGGDGVSGRESDGLAKGKETLNGQAALESHAWQSFTENAFLVEYYIGESWSKACKVGEAAKQQWRDLVKKLVYNPGWVVVSGSDSTPPLPLYFFAIRGFQNGVGRFSWEIKPAYPLVRRTLAAFVESKERALIFYKDAVAWESLTNLVRGGKAAAAAAAALLAERCALGAIANESGYKKVFGVSEDVPVKVKFFEPGRGDWVAGVNWLDFRESDNQRMVLVAIPEQDGPCKAGHAVCSLLEKSEEPPCKSFLLSP